MTQTANERCVGGVLVAGFFLACVALTQAHPGSWNDMSRIAAIESVVERGTWRIDESPWTASTKDKAFIDGHYFSDKLPLFNLLGAGVYAVMHRGWGASLAPDCRDSKTACAYYGLTLVTIGLPAAALVWLFFSFLLKQHVATATAALATAALTFGAMVWPYSLMLNHHLPSAAALFAGFYLLQTKYRRRSWVLAGTCSALAVSFDAVCLFVFGSLAAMSLVPVRRGAIYFGLGALAPVLLTIALDYQITGTPAPPYFMPGAYSFPGSAFPDSPGGEAPSADLFQYAFSMLIGNHGLYAYCSILLFATIGLAEVVFTRGHTLRWQAICIACGFIALSTYLITRTYNFGGVAYGERRYLHVIPLVMIFVVFASPLAASRWRGAIAAVFAVLFLLSVASGYQGARHPWRYSPPLVHLTRDPATGAIGWWWNASLIE